MDLVSKQRMCMEAITSYLTATKDYISGSSTSVDAFETFLQDIDEVELEAYLLNNMMTSPTYIESAVQEVKNFLASWRRDLNLRKMDRQSFFTDHDQSLANDVAMLRDLKELQSQYIRGRTPQQRS